MVSLPPLWFYEGYRGKLVTLKNTKALKKGRLKKRPSKIPVGKEGSSLPSSRKALRATSQGSDWRKKWEVKCCPERGEAGRRGCTGKDNPLPENMRWGHRPTRHFGEPRGLERDEAMKTSWQCEKNGNAGDSE